VIRMKTNLPVNVASAICYLPFVGWIAAIVFLIIESEKTVRYNAIQALLVDLAMVVAPPVLAVTVILIPLVPIAWIGFLILNIVLAIKTYRGETIKLPVAEKWANLVLEKLNMTTAKK